MDVAGAIPCVIYAAKSTEDKRGSIPDQLRECREAIEADPRRRFIAEYNDEAFSAYRRDRGPGLRDATQHAEDLAAQHGVAELWAQHSDRIARGDGRAAQHTVEVALWALKNDVRVRTLQDPDTFRDLLYAVVTGQRNNEDSKRKALATQAGRRRAVERGEYLGCAIDGYLGEAYLDKSQQARKRIKLDPERQRLIELMFRLALRGRTLGQIAASATRAGWLTKPARRGERAKPFDHSRVHEIITNPRYAAIACYRGEVLARGNWPAYISERQHRLILKKLAERDHGSSRERRESYLLERLARCGRCGASVHVLTGIRRRDGSNSRRYVCSSHTHLRERAQCPQPPIEAHTAEAMLIASLGPLLAGSWPEHPAGGLDAPGESAQAIRARLREAVLAEDDAGAERAIESLFGQMQPHAALLRQQAGAQRQARELADAQRLKDWLELEKHGRTEETRLRCKQLNQLLGTWFSEITILVEEEIVTIGARRLKGAGAPPAMRHVQVNRAVWTRGSIGSLCQTVRYGTWSSAEVIGALQAWASTHGRSPYKSDWRTATAEHPEASTVTERLGEWNDALALAKLAAPEPRVERRPWTQGQILKCLQAFKRQHGRAPRSMEWWRGAPGRPTALTVGVHFGGWEAAIAAAGLKPAPPLPKRAMPWAREAMLDALRAWAAIHGRAPRSSDWTLAAPEHPSEATVRAHFPSWAAALQAAELAPQREPAAWSCERVASALREWTANHGRTPISADWLCPEAGRPSRSTVYKRFGTWAAAVEAANLETSDAMHRS